MTAQIPAVAAAQAPVAPPALIPIQAAGTRETSTVTKGAIWKDGNHFVTITNVDGDLVEYGYPHRRDVFYLSRNNFQRQFDRINAGYVFTKKEKETLLSELKKCLAEIKAKNLGDHVYFMMDELGL